MYSIAFWQILKELLILQNGDIISTKRLEKGEDCAAGSFYAHMF